jgi:hypothetical protein
MRGLFLRSRCLLYRRIELESKVSRSFQPHLLFLVKLISLNLKSSANINKEGTIMDVRLKPQTRAPQITSLPRTLPAEESSPTKTVERVKDDFSTQADIYNASRNVGNQVSEAFTGVVGHVSGNVGLVLPTVGETYRNLWRAETIGPYAKTVGSIVALAGIPLVAGGALIASPFLGVAEAFKDDNYSSDPLVNNTTADVSKRITSNEDGSNILLGKAIENMQEFGDKKLAPGEEPWDIPINKIFKGALEGLNFLMVKVPVQVGKAIYRGGKATYKAGKTAAVESAKAVKKYGPKLAMAAAAGVTSTLIAGPAGLAIGVGISAVMAARDVKDAIFDKDRSFGSRVGGIAQTLAYIPVGPVMAGMSVKENFGRSFAEGWEGKPIEAIKTTGKAVIEKAKEALKGQRNGDKS